MRNLVAVLALTMAGLAHAQTPAPPAAADDSPIRDHDAIVVTGVQPGPGMWKVRKGDHALWILGTLSPLPKNFEWLSRDVEAVIAQADEVLSPPSVSFDANVGFFRGLTLLPAAMKARNNPDGAELKDVVPPALYARWAPLRKRYLGFEMGIEKRRPIYAASELYEAAIKRSRLSLEDIVAPVVRRATRARGIKITWVHVKVEIDDARATLRELHGTRLDDLDCFEKTLDRIESDIVLMRDRANAWAVGDVEGLRALPFTNQYEACIAAVTESGLAKKIGIGDLRERVENEWLTQARRALDENAVTFATLPISQLLKPDGLLARLGAQGYEIEAP